MHEPAGKQGPTREPVEDLVREFLAKTFTILGKKQSQSCSPKKSGFRVWTSVRFVNMLGGKEDPVCVHTGNILWGWGCYRHVKVPSSPYKRGREGTCKRIQTFWNLCYLQRESQSLCTLTLHLNVLRTLTCVWVVIRIFRVTPQHQGSEIFTKLNICHPIVKKTQIKRKESLKENQMKGFEPQPQIWYMVRCGGLALGFDSSS
jgi:hypothetical protein